MAFPVVQSRATGAQTSNSSTHNLGTTIASLGATAGDFLLVVFSVDGSPLTQVGVGSSAGWLKYEPQASNGTTVTGAIFYKIATGTDGLIVSTVNASTLAAQAEQSSWVVLRISGSIAITNISASRSNGSSANSDPPLCGPTVGEQDHLWIVTRSGDASVVATAAPLSNIPSAGYFTNLTTIAGGGQGASTNTAELSYRYATNNPTGWTSATEQWVCYTIAVWNNLQAEQTFSAGYQVLGSVPQSLSAGYAVLAAEAGGPAWFARTTDGYNTWAAYGEAQLVATQTFGAIYNVGGQTSNVFSATYRVGEATSGYSLTWFPILTDGYATWAGESVAEGTGSIDGGGVLPLSVMQTFGADYTVAVDVSNFRTVLYNVTGRATQTLDVEYDADGVVSQTFSGDYTIVEAAITYYDAAYDVFGIVGSVSNAYSVLYRVLASASSAYTASYQIFDKETIQSTFSATFNVVTEVSTDLTAGYWVNLIPMEPPHAEFGAEYIVYNAASEEYDAIYQVFTKPTADLAAEYSVGFAGLGDQVVDVFKYGPVEVDR